MLCIRWLARVGYFLINELADWINEKSCSFDLVGYIFE